MPLVKVCHPFCLSKSRLRLVKAAFIRGGDWSLSCHHGLSLGTPWSQLGSYRVPLHLFTAQVKRGQGADQGGKHAEDKESDGWSDVVLTAPVVFALSFSLWCFSRGVTSGGGRWRTRFYVVAETELSHWVHIASLCYILSDLFFWSR